MLGLQAIQYALTGAVRLGRFPYTKLTTGPATISFGLVQRPDSSHW